MTKDDHLPALDGLRGLAALLVVLAHLPKAGLTAAPPPFSGPLGVMLFFMLSGFLMGHLYLAKPFDRAACSRYLAARISRVLPLYYLVVVASFALTQLFGNAFSFHLALSQLLRLLLLTGHDYVFWSIPPEVQFYFVFLFVWALARNGRLAAWLPAAAFTVATLFLLRPLFPGISVLGQLQIFLTGVAIAVVRRRYVARISSRAALAVQIAGLLTCLLIVAGVISIDGLVQGTGRSKDDIAYADLPLALTVGSVLFAYTIDTRFARAVFANRVAERLGAWSFGIYLLHWPVMHAVSAALADTPLPPLETGGLALAVSIAAAAAVYNMYEMPMQRLLRPRLSRWFEWVFTAPRPRPAPRTGTPRSGDSSNRTCDQLETDGNGSQSRAISATPPPPFFNGDCRTVVDHKRVCVIVPVWNNAAQLLRCVAALQAQDYPSDLYEIVVVDNGSTDDTAARARETGVRVLEQRKPGSYAARNFAIAETKSDFIAFTDSDCVPDRQWLSTAMARAERERALGVVAGRIVLFDDEASGVGSGWARSYEALVAFPQHQASEGTCATANWLSPRRAIVDAGGFDETVKSGGDHHMGLSLRKAGLTLVYEPEMIVGHPTRATFEALLAKRRRLTGGHWDRTLGRMRLPRAMARNLLETGRRGKKILVAPDASLTDRLKAEAILIALGVADIGEYVRLSLGGSTVR